ncbi:chondroitinase family polysaccharide lyase [Chitinophagaceae bacterium LB-8]|uniref:Chondroitinase family polysaccharide lyase n=1 Tax=Paraflavisolibacter caeni TaxID=2982496 RepID=A0A9X2XQ35_9BACT|nr:polysaccharide lyase family 8 super-sandwich domain-containing protein [Paraflavisolibacter caeni]MCU7552868.1 chondroitinase family polysaccharide lyase [Paraflavisolibacter caeni]
MKRSLLFLLNLLLVSLAANATDYYTASATATLAGNTGVVNANWTTNPDGTTGLTSVAIAATDNLIILNGGVASITNSGTMTIAALNINAGGTIIHNNNAWASSFTITGLLTWNGTIKTLQAASGGSNFFSANGNVTGTTAIHDVNSVRGVYLGGTGKTLSLTQLSTGVTSANSISIGLLLGSSHSLAGNCKFYSPLIYNATTVTLDLNGYNLQASTIKQGNTSTRLIKGNANSKLTISGTSATLPNSAATVITFDPAAAVLNELNVNSEYLSTAVGPVTINGNLTVNSLNFGTASGDKATRNLQVNGNFTLANNGSMRVQAGGPTAVTTYDQLNATGNISIGTSTTLTVDIINAYSPTDQPFLTFAQSTSPGTVSGTFGTIKNTTGYTSDVTYTGNAVKYQILTSPPPAPPPPPCPISLVPDLPLVPSNPTVEAEINTAVQRFSDSYLGTTEPTAAALASAVASYNALNITVSGYTISAQTAVTSYGQTAFLKTFAQYIKFHPEDNDIFTKALNTVWLVSDRMCKGLFAADYNQYSYRDFGRAAILIPRIKDNPHVKGLFENLLYQQNNFRYFWEPNYNGGINDDHMGNSGNVTMAYVKWIDSADERFRYMTAFKRFMENFTSYTAGAAYSGIKPDGSGFHHNASYPSYMYNLNGAADIVSYLRGTSFEVSSAGYLRLRDAIMAQLMFTNDNTTRFLTMTGRKPEEIATTISKFNFRAMAVAGGSILGTGTSDPVMATFYNRVWGGYGPFGNSTVAPFNSGYFQFNHSMAGIYRKDGWLAVCKGFNNNMFGAEIFEDANRYGRYQSYGAVNIIYPGDALTGNGYDVTTWDWNFTPGATVIRLPWDKLRAEKERIDELQQKRFVGSLSFVNKNSSFLKAIHGTYGMFAMDFQEKTDQGWGTVYSSENHNPTFVFKKSVFTFDNMLICLGSGIGNNDAANTTLTTLFQRKTATGKDVVNVDGNLLQAGSYDNNYSGSGNHWLVDNYGTGFYVFSGSGDIKLTRADQQVPLHSQVSPTNISSNPIGNYAIGYIDHGLAPTDKGYEYVCMPKAAAADMTNLDNLVAAGNKPYTVHRKDSIAHIVEYKPANGNAIFGYSFFNPLSGIDNNGQLTGADYPCLVMSRYNSTQKNLQLAVTNPDLGFTWRSNAPSVTRQINVTIKGTNWEITQANAAAAITGTANGETTIQFTTVDGLPVEIVLSRVLTPQTISFEAIPTKTTTDSAFALTATASSGLPVSYTSSNTAVATISGNTVTIVGKGTSTITASQLGDDIYGAATTIEQILTVIDVELPVLAAPANVEVTTDAGAAIASNVALGTATATDNDGVQSITNNAPAVFPVGITKVIWTAVDNSGNVATAIQLVTVTDNEVPVVTAPANQSFCYAASNNYQVPAAATADNCGLATIIYAITGATERTGTSVDASGQFNTGLSTITWTVTDIHGNQTIKTCTVNINEPLNASIPAVYAMNPAVDAKNTLYIGYGPSSLAIGIVPVGGAMPYTYLWNTGYTSESISISAAGTYAVTVTDARGCSSTASTMISTLDVTCGKNSDKVMICHNEKTICIASADVQDHLNHGDKLGSCNSTVFIALNSDRSAEEFTAHKVVLYPNPVNDILTISLSKLETGAIIQLYNANGVLLVSQRLTKMTQTVSMKGLVPGIYYVQVKNGNEITSEKVLKQ